MTRETTNAFTTKYLALTSILLALFRNHLAFEYRFKCAGHDLDHMTLVPLIGAFEKFSYVKLDKK